MTRGIALFIALVTGLLLAIAIHVLGGRIGLDLAALWAGGAQDGITARAALAWWAVASAAFVGSYATARLLANETSGAFPRRLRDVMIGVIVLVILAGAQSAASPAGATPIGNLIVTSLVVFALGTAMAFCGAHFALAQRA